MANVVKFANIGTTRGAGGERLSIVSILKFFSKNEEREREFSKRGILPAHPIFALLLGKFTIFPGRSYNFPKGEKPREDKLKIARTCLKQIWSVEEERARASSPCSPRRVHITSG